MVLYSLENQTQEKTDLSYPSRAPTGVGYEQLTTYKRSESEPAGDHRWWSVFD
ncbi:MAG: hypothetical protein Q7K43_01875 [Candidatus Woesearchaeota archaeon]|nr:hypothetical protein [Candidatus Woesearchaeota archaeon]